MYTVVSTIKVCFVPFCAVLEDGASCIFRPVDGGPGYSRAPCGQVPHGSCNIGRLTASVGSRTRSTGVSFRTISPGFPGPRSPHLPPEASAVCRSPVLIAGSPEVSLAPLPRDDEYDANDRSEGEFVNHLMEGIFGISDDDEGDIYSVAESYEAASLPARQPLSPTVYPCGREVARVPIQLERVIV
ncbi:hypothetical protein L915_03269 [Phytophthora nicotianae]|uniref:Uncharacterized protein n=2 Tax=Phytophthora nicotianae TaxID=4792 RepID=W2HG78_PHYNI|nr:hypothetical protein L915_03269 [Phytophthora nicotianae]